MTMSQHSSKKPDSIGKQKQLIRTRARSFRASLSPDEQTRRWQRICRLLEDVIVNNLDQGASIHVYEAIPSLGEIDIAHLLPRLADMYTLSLQSHEPKFPRIQFDACIIPSLALGRDGSRLGYGMGAYDSFLRSQINALKISPQYDELILDSLPREAHDVPIDIIVSEGEIIRRRS